MNQVEGLGILAANIDLLGQLEGTECLLSNSYHSICLHSYIAFGYREENVVPAVEWTLRKMKELRDLKDPGENFPLRKVSGTVKECAGLVLSGVERLAQAQAEKNRTLSEGLQKALEEYRKVPVASMAALLTQVRLNKAPAVKVETANESIQEQPKTDHFVRELQNRVQARFTAKQKEAEIIRPTLPVRFAFELRRQKRRLKKIDISRSPAKDELLSVLTEAFDKVREKLQSSIIEPDDLTMSFLVEEQPQNAHSN